jgi:hypothetical protein
MEDIGLSVKENILRSASTNKKISFYTVAFLTGKAIV